MKGGTPRNPRLPEGGIQRCPKSLDKSRTRRSTIFRRNSIQTLFSSAVVLESFPVASMVLKYFSLKIKAHD